LLGRFNRRSLHFAPPDFLWNLMASARSMRLSSRKGAYAASSSAARQEVRVRSGRDDNSVAKTGVLHNRAVVNSRQPQSNLSSRPKRSAVEGPAVGVSCVPVHRFLRRISILRPCQTCGACPGRRKSLRSSDLQQCIPHRSSSDPRHRRPG
jgi:hypothetical protein